jgi:hypothetical protein
MTRHNRDTVPRKIEAVLNNRFLDACALTISTATGMRPAWSHGANSLGRFGLTKIGRDRALFGIARRFVQNSTQSQLLRFVSDLRDTVENISNLKARRFPAWDDAPSAEGRSEPADFTHYPA